MGLFERDDAASVAAVAQKPKFARASEAQSAAVAVAKPRCILIVEDDYFVGLEAEEILENAGFHVIGIAATAHEAVARATQGRPDLIMMDIRLAQGGDGIDTAISLYQGHGFRSVFVTAHSDRETRARAVAAKPLGWVIKPFAPESLVQAVFQALSAKDREDGD
ncbi:MAG TPA: response regulator [Methylovirgula sp.]